MHISNTHTHTHTQCYSQVIVFILLLVLLLVLLNMCAAAETGYSFDKIKLLELEGARNQGSPSRSLLWELGSRNTTVRQLYGYLNSLSRYREMKILEDYGECSFL